MKNWHTVSGITIILLFSLTIFFTGSDRHISADDFDCTTHPEYCGLIDDCTYEGAACCTRFYQEDRSCKGHDGEGRPLICCQPSNVCEGLCQYQYATPGTYTTPGDYPTPDPGYPTPPPASYVLTVTKSGNGNGVITSYRNGVSEEINCGSICQKSFTSGTQVSLSVAPSAGSDFIGWTGSCSGGTCSPIMTQSRSVNAVLQLIPYTLTAVINSGSGTITSSPAGINCPGDCSQVYDYGQTVELTPYPTPPTYSFGGWSGFCSGFSSPCSVLIDANKGVGAYFNLVQAFNYFLSNSGTSNAVKGSGNVYTQNTITKSLISGTTEPVSLALSGVPGHVSYSLSNGTCSPDCQTTILFTIDNDAVVGTYPIIVTGAPLGKTTSFNLVISSGGTGGGISVSCSASPLPAYIGRSVTWTGAVSGGTAPYTYSWSGTNIPTNPAPSTNPFNIVYTSGGRKTAKLTVTDSIGRQAACTGENGVGDGGVIYVNFDPDFEEF